LPGKTAVILADTVGFIRHLPHDLVEAFKSTMEEVAEADLLLHVVDSGNAERLDQMQRVNEVLAEIHADSIPQIVVFNKIDVTGEPAHAERDSAGNMARVWLSAQSGDGVDLLLAALAEHFQQQHQLQHLALPPEAGRLRASLYERFGIVTETVRESGGWLIDLSLDPTQLAWLQRQPDYREEFLLAKPAHVLAPTGS